MKSERAIEGFADFAGSLVLDLQSQENLSGSVEGKELARERWIQQSSLSCLLCFLQSVVCWEPCGFFLSLNGCHNLSGDSVAICV